LYNCFADPQEVGGVGGGKGRTVVAEEQEEDPATSPLSESELDPDFMKIGTWSVILSGGCVWQ